MLKKPLKYLIITLLFLPFSVLGALQFQYPEVPGTGQTITEKTSLGGVVKYFATWAIIVAAVAAFISLIYAGIMYLTAAGKPQQMAEGKNKALNSFLGLAILLGSYLILATINPELTVLYVERVPVESGIALISNEGVGRGFGDEVLSDPDLIRFLNFSVNDSIKAFGELIEVEEDADGETFKVNHRDFGTLDKVGVDEIAFICKSGKKPNVKVIFYSEKDFKGEVSEYESEGLPCEVGLGVPFFKTKVKFKDDGVEKEAEVNHPPLSYRILGLGPGIYLYSETGDVRYFPNSVGNFIYSNVDFDNQADSIEIKNNLDTDYLAVLYPNPRHEGEFRIFFERKKRGEPPPVGNVAPDTKKLLGDYDGVDQYGKIQSKKASSVYVAQLSEDSSACQEVRVCTGDNFIGECLVYNPSGEGDYNQDVYLAYKKLPVFLPQNLPELELTKLDKDGEEEGKLVKFDNNVNSIKVVGKCLVTLFDHKIHEDYDTECPPDGSDPEKCWEVSWILRSGDEPPGPGGHSEAFINSDLTLSDNNIGGCSPWHRLKFIQTNPCASSIAIYPIK